MKKTLYTLLILAILGFAGFIAAFNHYALDRYEEMDSPYDLNDEYNTVLISRLIRGYAGKIGISDDSWALSPVIEWHREAYKEALEVIPGDDGERIIWESDFNIGSYKKEAKQDIASLINRAANLMHSKYANKYFKEIDRYALLNGILRESLNNHKTLNHNQKKYLINVAFDLSKEINFETFDRERSQEIKLVPLRIAINGFVLFMIDSNYKYLYECPEKAEILKYLSSRLLQLFKKYENIDRNKVQESLAFSKGQYDIVKDKIPYIINSCNNNRAEMNNDK